MQKNLILMLKKLLMKNRFSNKSLSYEDSDFKKSKAKSMGATGWLQKPFDPERLMKAVNKLVG